MQSRRQRAAIAALATGLLGTAALPAMASGSYVKNGVWYQTDAAGNAEEVALFGANYSLPFAFGYRAVKAMGLSHQEMIRLDVAHLARLGVTAYRIHLWDRLISDRDGNLLNNEHLQLFDFLLAELQRYNIKAVVTPIGWWGSGYPAPDPAEPGFSVLYSKNQMNEQADAIKAQHRYLSALMAHKNLNGVPYAQDPNILAFELFNEPKHADAQAVTAYVNGLIKVMRDAGVTKPLFYNSSEQGNWPEFAKSLCESNIDGVSFQWYPTGLLKFSSLHTNVLGSVAQYHNPFKDIAACATKAKMIYEFDAADVTAPLLYPAMARSFRSAGFQWATQFAYDPAALAASNAEYNTHYLNLLYTPAKAISFLIAGEVFRNLPRGVQPVAYPASNQFGGPLNVQLAPASGLALLNSGRHFYHSNSTDAAPADLSSLAHIAGVGSSPLVQYQGSGAYFLDKQQAGLWQLEVYPDATQLDDPHQNSSLKREAVRLSVSQRAITIKLAELGKNFVLQTADRQQIQAKNGTVTVAAGRYLLAKTPDLLAHQQLSARPFLLPTIAATAPLVVHQPLRQWPIDQPLPICGQLAASGDVGRLKVSVFYRLTGESQVQQQLLQAEDAGRYCTKLKLPAQSGLLQYQLVVQDHQQPLSFPGAVAALPSDWDFPHNAQHSFSTQLQQPGATVPLFDARVDQTALLYPKDAQVTQQWLAGERQQGLVLRLRPAKTPDWQQAPLPLLRTEIQPVMGLNRRDLSGYSKVAVKIRAISNQKQAKMPLRFALLNQDGLAFGIDLEASNDWRYQLIPLQALTATPSLLTQAYPTFMPAQLTHQGQQLGELSLLQGTQWQLLAPSDGNIALEIAEVSLMR